MTRPDPSAFLSGAAILDSLAEMVAVQSGLEGLPEDFIELLADSDPSGSVQVRLIEGANRRRVRIGAEGLRQVGLGLSRLPTGWSLAYDGGEAWLHALARDSATSRWVLVEQEIAECALERAPRGSQRLDRAVVAVVRAVVDDTTPALRPELSRFAGWIVEHFGGADAPAAAGVPEALATVLAAFAPEIDVLAGGAFTADLRTARFDPAYFDRLLTAVADTARLFRFVLTPMLATPIHGRPEAGLLSTSYDVLALTAIEALLTISVDGTAGRRSFVVADELRSAWPLGDRGTPVGLGRLGRDGMRRVLQLAAASDGYPAGVIAAAP